MSTTDEARRDSGRTGARFGPYGNGRRTTAAADRPAPGDTQPGRWPDHADQEVRFETVIRGYARGQVNQFVAEKNTEIARLRRELTEAQRQRRLATAHAEGTETELRELRAATAHPQPARSDDSFGYRAETLLRMAEQEATAIRSQACRESVMIIEEGRIEAEKYRHEVERRLIARAALLQQQAAQYSAELHEREQEIADQLHAACEQADQLHAAVVRAADQLREQSVVAAAQTIRRAATTAQGQLDQAQQELARLSALHTDVRSELARLAQMLAPQLPQARMPATNGANRHNRRCDSTVTSPATAETVEVPSRALGHGGNLSIEA